MVYYMVVDIYMHNFLNIIVLNIYFRPLYVMNLHNNVIYAAIAAAPINNIIKTKQHNFLPDFF